ncbi:DNA polymerase III subunit gamma and tau, partial [Streptomyces sp. NPDC002690]
RPRTSSTSWDWRTARRRAPSTSSCSPAPAPAAPVAPASAAPTGGQDMAQGAGQVRSIWPEILEAVKNHRRFTWILLSQNAQVTGFDGTTLQIGFANAGARDTFASSGSEAVLRQALAERFNAQWRVEAIVDPSGGGGQPMQGGGGRPGGGAPAYQAPAYQAAPPQSYEQRPAPAPAPQQPQSSPPPQQSQQSQGGQGGSGPASGAYERSAPEPVHTVAPEDDTPEADDPDLVDSALSGHELIVRELGATVVEEFTNE